MAGIFWRVTFSSWTAGYLPWATAVALLLATPMGRGRKLVALLLGTLLVHAYVAVRIAFLALRGFQKRNGRALDPERRGPPIDLIADLGSAGNALVESLAGLLHEPPFAHVVPVVIWLLVLRVSAAPRPTPS